MSFYRINVARNGQHFFATADYSLTSRRKALRVLRALCKAFPSHDGNEVTILYVEAQETAKSYTPREFAMLCV